MASTATSKGDDTHLGPKVPVRRYRTSAALDGIGYNGRWQLERLTSRRTEDDVGSVEKQIGDSQPLWDFRQVVCVVLERWRTICARVRAIANVGKVSPNKVPESTSSLLICLLASSLHDDSNVVLLLEY